MNFEEMQLIPPLLRSVEQSGYEVPTPIQRATIPLVLAGKDVLGCAQTGTGKTAAFGLPLVEHVDPEIKGVQALVLTPTRELCIQVTQALRTYGARKGVEVVAVARRRPAADDAQPVSHLVERVTAEWPEPIDWELDPGPHPHEAAFLSLDSTAAREQLGWRPGWDLDAGIAATVDWFAALRDGRDTRAVALEQIAAFSGRG